MNTAPEPSRERDPVRWEECHFLTQTAAGKWLVTSLDGTVIHRIHGTVAAR